MKAQLIVSDRTGSTICLDLDDYTFVQHKITERKWLVVLLSHSHQIEWVPQQDIVDVRSVRATGREKLLGPLSLDYSVVSRPPI